MKISLTYKLLAGFMAVVIIVIAVAGVSGSILIRNYFIADKENELISKAYELSRLVNSYHNNQISGAQLQSFVNNVDNFLDARVWVVDNNLNLVNISEIRPSMRDYRERRMMGMGDAGRPPVPYGRGMMGRMRGMVDYCMPDAGMRRHHDEQSQSASSDERERRRQITLDLGRESDNPVSLSDLQNMQELSQIIATNQSRPWSKTYYHPYYKENMIIAAVPLVSSAGSQTGTIILSAPLAKIDEFLNEIYFYLLLTGLLGILFAALLTAYLSRGIVRPLKTMQIAASNLALGEYGARVSVSSSDEVGDLGRSLNSLAEDLGHYVSQMKKTDVMRRDFVANVSHELRTPLTILRGYNQALEDGTINSPVEIEKYRRIMGDEIGRLEKLISELLDLSLLEADGHILELEQVDLKEIIDNVLGLLQKRGQECYITFLTDIEKDVPYLTADGGRLTQLVLILMDNALKFTKPGGTVKIALSQKDAKTVLTISDTGDGISAEDMPHIWERFYKKDPSRLKQGAGLGLAIAKQILELHKAQVQVLSQPGQGTTFRITF
jgi:signal transduction histidine kinase